MKKLYSELESDNFDIDMWDHPHLEGVSVVQFQRLAKVEKNLEILRPILPRNDSTSEWIFVGDCLAESTDISVQSVSLIDHNDGKFAPIEQWECVSDNHAISVDPIQAHLDQDWAIWKPIPPPGF